MSARDVETLLARLLGDPDFRRVFLEDPLRQARRAGLSDAEAQEMARMDRAGLELAGDSFDAKRSRRRGG